MSQTPTNHIKIGSSSKLSLSKGNITVGVKGTTDYGPTSNSGFYNGIVPTAGGYVIYINPTGSELRAHAPKSDAECMLYLKKYGAPNGDIYSMLNWALTQNTILVISSELTNCTGYVQNVAGTNGNIGFFFGAFRNEYLFDLVKVGWLVRDNPTWVVTAVNREYQTIEISGGEFQSGQSYGFCLNTDLGLTIATNDGGGLTGWAANSASIPYSATVIAAYPIGSTITFQDNTTATITGWDDYGPTYIDIFWNTSKSGTIFPITLR